MGGRFELIAQQIIKQKELMEKMEAENRLLRQQLADLRAGRGIYVVLNGQRIEINTLQTTPLAISSSATEEKEQTTSTPQAEAYAQPIETAMSSTDAQDNKQAEEKREETPTFLEEIMLNEFETALTSQFPVRKGTANTSAKTRQLEETVETSEEEQKETLRRELMGSYLLE